MYVARDTINFYTPSQASPAPGMSPVVRAFIRAFMCNEWQRHTIITEELLD